MRLLFIVFLLFGFYGTPRVYGQQLIPVSPVPYQTAWQVPQTILVPQTTMVPYQLEQSQVIRREYATPLRDLLLGRYRMQHIYRPQQVQQ